MSERKFQNGERVVHKNIFKVGDEVRWLRRGQQVQGIIQGIDITDWDTEHGCVRVVIRGAGIAFPFLSDLSHVSDMVALSRTES